MKKTLIACVLLASMASFAVQADDAAAPASGAEASGTNNAANNGGWTGSGEFGLPPPPATRARRTSMASST